MNFLIKKYFLILLCLQASLLGYGQNNEVIPDAAQHCRRGSPSCTGKVVWDIDFSPYAGGENLLLVHNALQRVENYIFQDNPVAHKRTASAQFWRLAELITIWLPANYFTMVVQHEVFGHGYRIRDLENQDVAEVCGYSFTAPPPYGSGEGATRFVLLPGFNTLQAAAVASAGVEGTAILANQIKWNWFSRKQLDPKQAVLFLLSQHDLSLYISSLSTEDALLDGHDIKDYIDAINLTYPGSRLTEKQVQALAWINCVDPATFYAIYAWFHYIASGEETKIPLIASCYLPNLRLGLTPFGPQIFCENFVMLDNTPFYFYLAGGSHAHNHYVGAGFYAPRLYHAWRWDIGCRLDVWRQPQLVESSAVDMDEFTFIAQPPGAQRCGISGALIAEYANDRRWGYQVEAGYKSAGFLPGYSLCAFPTIRISGSVTF